LVLVWFVPIPRGYLWRLGWIAFVAATVQYGLTFSGLARMDATPAVLLVQSEVVFGVLLAALLLGERPTIRQLLGIATAFAGILVIVGAPSLEGQLTGVLLIFGGTVTWAFGQVLVRRLKGALGGLQLTAWMGVMAGPQMIVAALLLENDIALQLTTASSADWLTVAYLGVVMTVIGYSAWYYVLARYPVPMVMPMLLLLPVATILGAVTFLGERPDMIVLLGGGVVIAGVGLVIIDPAALLAARRKQKTLTGKGLQAGDRPSED
ncbi:MAG: EamA family transporter, partial [Alphaproteobacteria bacterium]|nr:EamA family transporter [Alphaproteobacteria bacterium]